MASSSSNSRNLPNALGATSGAAVAENGNGPDPNSLCRTVDAAAPTPQCAQGDSGCIGSGSKAVQSEADPLARIAVTGRHALSGDFASKIALTASLIPKFTRAMARVELTRSSALACTACRAILFQTINPGGAWYRAMSVCAFVRIALSFSPSAFTSPRSRRHWALSMAGGGGGRNWLDLSNPKVCILPREGEAIIPVDVGTYMPVPGTGV